jgi:hypothetical protein
MRNPSVLKLDGLPYCAIINTPQYYWPSRGTLTNPILLIYYIINYNKTEQIARSAATTQCIYIAAKIFFFP